MTGCAPLPTTSARGCSARAYNADNGTPADPRWPASRAVTHPPRPRGRLSPSEGASMSPDLNALLDRLRQEALAIARLTAEELDLLGAYLDSLPPPPPSRPTVMGTFSSEVVRRFPTTIPDPAADARAWRFH